MGNPSIPSLNKYQVSVLKRLANNPCKIYCCPAGTLRDNDGDSITQDFNDILILAELGLVVDVSDAPKFANLIADHANEGRDVVVVNLSKRGQKMFERTKWERRVN